MKHHLLIDSLKNESIRATYMKNYGLTEEKLIELRREVRPISWEEIRKNIKVKEDGNGT